MRELIRRRPVLSLVVTAAVALFIGVAIGLSDTGSSSLRAELDDVTEERDDALDDLADAEEELEDLEAAVADALGEAARAERRADRARKRARNQAAATEQPSSDSDSGTYQVGDFTITDVQVSEDFGGDFELRARVTNNGGDMEFVDLQATLFSDGTVVGVVDALEDFDAGQTRTVTFIGSDSYTDWDKVEFTIDTY